MFPCERLRQLLSGERVAESRSELIDLRYLATPFERVQLDRLESELIRALTPPPVSQAELTRRALRRFEPASPGPKESSAEMVRGILDGHIAATRATLHELLDNAAQTGLSTEDQGRLRTLLHVPPARPSVDIGHQRTPFGFVSDDESFNATKLHAERSIAHCPHHKLPNCNCWSDARAWLWQIRKQHPERSAESWLALKIWEQLETLENHAN